MAQPRWRKPLARTLTALSVAIVAAWLTSARWHFEWCGSGGSLISIGEGCLRLTRSDTPLPKPFHGFHVYGLGFRQLMPSEFQLLFSW